MLEVGGHAMKIRRVAAHLQAPPSARAPQLDLRPEEIAGLFVYLASDDAAFATGHVFTLDGGETAGGLASR